MHQSFTLVEKSVLRICKFPIKEALLIANHFYLSDRGDFSHSLGWGPSGLEVRGRVQLTTKEIERIDQFVGAARYSIATNNCEHFAKYVKHGLPLSAQLDTWWMRLGAEAIAMLQPTQDKRTNISDYVGKQVSDLFKENLRQARIARASQRRGDFWKARGVDLS